MKETVKTIDKIKRLIKHSKSNSIGVTKRFNHYISDLSKPSLELLTPDFNQNST